MFRRTSGQSHPPFGGILPLNGAQSVIQNWSNDPVASRTLKFVPISGAKAAWLSLQLAPKQPSRRKWAFIA